MKNTVEEMTVEEIAEVIMQSQNALRRVLPMAEAWFRREFPDGFCDHESGECHCDREARARADINIARAALFDRKG